MNSLDSFRAALRQSGLVFNGTIVADGKLHRFKASSDHDRNSWYVLHADSPAAGAFGCWKRSIKETWCENGREKFSDPEWQATRERWQQAERDRERTELERRDKARKTANWILSRSKPVVSHAYLAAKGVKTFGDVREYRGALVLPLCDASGELHSLQFIGADGKKRFLRGGRIAGCSFTLVDKADGALVVCEGYATGASIHEAMGLAVACAMNCGNLPAIAEALRVKWPHRQIVIAGDNDQFTDGNPGVAKATEAATAIDAKLAVPHFTDVSGKPTDFNDVAARSGFAELKKQIDAALTPKESEDQIVRRLAALPALEYERQRGAAAEGLGCRAAILDKLIEAERAKRKPTDGDLQGSGLDLSDVEPWNEPVSGADVLNQIAETFLRYVALPDGATDTLALWCAHAHAFDAFVCSPRLNVSSPEKGCGKTTLRDVLAVLVPRPLATENFSVAVLFRVIQSDRPTILADECDTWLRDNDELRGILNAGHGRSGTVARCVGDHHEVRRFKVFAPAVLCGIGSLPGTLHDRSIVIRLERAKRGELRGRFDSRRTEREHELNRKLARFCADNRVRLENCEPSLPPDAFNRLADNWRPLFAVAEIAGGDWPRRARVAFAKLTSREDSDAQGTGTILLADIRQAFQEQNSERIFSKDLVVALCAMTDRPWQEAHRGRAITESWLARKLRTFEIAPRTLRIGDHRAKGYERSDFQDAFERYLSAAGFVNRDSRDNPTIADVSATLKSVTDSNAVTDAKPHGEPDTIELSPCHGSNLPAEAILL